MVKSETRRDAEIHVRESETETKTFIHMEINVI